MNMRQAAPQGGQVSDSDEIWARIGISLITVGFLVEAVRAAIEYFA